MSALEPGVIDENMVVEVTAALLAQDGWTIVSTASTTSHGYDVVAEHDNARLIVEAKGAISATKTDAKPFTKNMARQSVEAALYKIARAISEEAGTHYVIAVPDTAGYRAAIENIERFLAAASIRVIWADSSGAWHAR